MDNIFKQIDATVGKWQIEWSAWNNSCITSIVGPNLRYGSTTECVICNVNGIWKSITQTWYCARLLEHGVDEWQFANIIRRHRRITNPVLFSNYLSNIVLDHDHARIATIIAHTCRTQTRKNPQTTKCSKMTSSKRAQQLHNPFDATLRRLHDPTLNEQ